MTIRGGISAIEKHITSHQFELHRRLLDMVEPQVVGHLEQWKMFVEQEAQRIDNEDQQEELYDLHIDEYNDRQQLNVIFMNSLFLASFSLFEDRLVFICKRAEMRCLGPRIQNEVKIRSTTEFAKKQFRTLGLSFPSNSPEWANVMRYRKIRNAIAHEGGTLLSPKKHIVEFASSKGIISTLRKYPELELTRAFCEDASHQLERFLLMAHEAAYAEPKYLPGVPSRRWLASLERTLVRVLRAFRRRS